MPTRSQVLRARMARPVHSRSGWTEFQRREGTAFLDWLDREQRLHKGFDAIASTMRDTLSAHASTCSDARDVWKAVPAVLGKCNDPVTYCMRHSETAYAWLHFLDRYVRTWLALKKTLKASLLPMGKHGARVLDIGTGPGPSAFATHDFYVAMEDYAQATGAGDWRQPPDIRCVERALGMNYIRHNIAESLAIRGAPRSVLAMTGGMHNFGEFFPSRDRRQFERDLRDYSEEYYDEQRREWHTDFIFTPEQANRKANTQHRYRLFTFSNFLTTPDAVWRYQENMEDILADARLGSVLLMIGAKGGDYPTIRRQMTRLATAGGFRHPVSVGSVASSEAGLHHRLDEELRWFYRHLEQLAGKLPADEPDTCQLQHELGCCQPIKFNSSVIHGFRK